jgi:hypothetical protein
MDSNKRMPLILSKVTVYPLLDILDIIFISMKRTFALDYCQISLLFRFNYSKIINSNASKIASSATARHSHLYNMPNIAILQH